jgi:hypothetical protein
MLRGIPPPSSYRSHPLPSGGPCEEILHRLPIVATRCQAVDLARKSSTVWRTVATGERQLRENETNRSHPLPSGGCCQENLHRLANGGYMSTTTTGERRLRQNGGYGSTAVTAERNVNRTEPA